MQPVGWSRSAARLGTLWLVVAALTGCSVNAPIPVVAPLVTVEMRGGLCPAGVCETCEVDIDWADPLFVAVGVALGQWLPLPSR